VFDRSSRRSSFLLLALLGGSGCSALIYEIVWLELLQLVIGASGVSLAVLLGTFMGGMCLGSLALPRVFHPRTHPLRVYALLEAVAGLLGLAALAAVPLVGGLYIAAIGRGLPGFVLRGAVASFCLLPPTMVMGATLPAVGRWVGTRDIGFLYGGNIIGGVVGSLLASFYLLRVHDLRTATFVAAGINFIVAAISLLLARNHPELAALKIRAASAGPEQSEALPPRRRAADIPVYLAIAISGMAALGAEVVWTRMLALMIGATVYAFSLILAVFLFGLGIGSTAGSLVARRTRDARLALALCQVFVAAAIAWTASLMGRSMPFWTTNATVATDAPVMFARNLMQCAYALLPAAGLWGACFPLAVAALTTPRGAGARATDAARIVGATYSANTLGGIVGAVAFSTIVIPALGSGHAQRLLIALSGAAAMAVWPRREPAHVPRAAIASAAMAFVLCFTIPEVPPLLVAFGRAVRVVGSPAVLYVGEGVTSSVAVSEVDSGARSFSVSGRVEASSEPEDMRVERMLAYLPALLHPKPRSVLVVGFGAGVTAGSFVPDPNVERIVICEIEPLIPQRVAPYFEEQNHAVLSDPRVHLVIDDARHYILTTSEKFDIITSDPIHPWVKGSATLYTREYFDLLREHLNPGGVVAQWVPLYESHVHVVKSEIATFFSVFGNSAMWGNPKHGVGYDVVLTGTAAPASIELDGIEQRLEHPDYAGVAGSLGDVGFWSAADLLATYAGARADLEPWLADAEINRDQTLRLQYLAGFGLNALEGGQIYDEILSRRLFPGPLFHGSAAAKERLSAAAGRSKIVP